MPKCGKGANSNKSGGAAADCFAAKLKNLQGSRGGNSI